MAIEGKVRTLYTDKTQQEAIFPTTKVSAVTDDEGNGLNTLLEHIAYVDPTDMESAAVLANADTLGGYPASDYAFIEDLKNLKPEDIGAVSSQNVWVEDLNLAKESGFYSWTDTALNKPFDYGSLIVVSRISTYDRITQIAFDPFMVGDGQIAIRHYSGLGETGWYDWAYINPPMKLGQEYKTIERYNGKSVYTKAINCGALPNASIKNFNHNISNMEACLSATGITTDSSGYGYNFPLESDFETIGRISIYVNSTLIQISTTVDWSTTNAVVILKYTKTTE